MQQSILKKLFEKYAPDAADDVSSKETAIEAAKGIHDLSYFADYFSKNPDILNHFGDEDLSVLSDDGLLYAVRNAKNPTAFVRRLDPSNPEQAEHLLSLLSDSDKADDLSDEQTLTLLRVYREQANDIINKSKNGNKKLSNLRLRSFRELDSENAGKYVQQWVESENFKHLDDPNTVIAAAAEYFAAGHLPKDTLGKALSRMAEPDDGDYERQDEIFETLFNMDETPYDLIADQIDESHIHLVSLNEGVDVSEFLKLYNSATPEQRDRLVYALFVHFGDEGFYIQDERIFSLETKHLATLLPRIDEDSLNEPIPAEKTKALAESGVNFDKIIPFLDLDSLLGLNLDFSKVNLESSPWINRAHFLAKLLRWYQRSGWSPQLTPLWDRVRELPDYEKELPNLIKEISNDGVSKEEIHHLGLKDEKEALEHAPYLRTPEGDLWIKQHREELAKLSEEQLLEHFADADDDEMLDYVIQKIGVDGYIKYMLKEKRLQDIFSFLKDRSHIEDVELPENLWLEIAHLASESYVNAFTAAEVLEELGEDAKIFLNAKGVLSWLAHFIAKPEGKIGNFNDTPSGIMKSLSPKTLLNLIEKTPEFYIKFLAVESLIETSPEEFTTDDAERFLDELHASNATPLAKKVVAEVLKLLESRNSRVSNTIMTKLAERGYIARYKKPIDKKAALPHDVHQDERLDLLRLLLPLAR